MLSGWAAGGISPLAVAVVFVVAASEPHAADAISPSAAHVLLTAAVAAQGTGLWVGRAAGDLGVVWWTAAAQAGPAMWPELLRGSWCEAEAQMRWVSPEVNRCKSPDRRRREP